MLKKYDLGEALPVENLKHDKIIILSNLKQEINDVIEFIKKKNPYSFETTYMINSEDVINKLKQIINENK